MSHCSADATKELIIRLKSLLSRWRRFEGGLFLPTGKGPGPADNVLPFPDPRRLVVPVMDPSAHILVEPGQKVQSGQMLARRENGPGLHIRAPRAGRVIAVVQASTALRTDVPAIIIETNSPDRDGERAEESRPDLASPSTGDPDPLTAGHLATLADEAGIPAFTGRGESFGRQLRQVADRRVIDLIINGMLPEPVLTARGVTLREQLATVVKAAGWLRAAVGSRRLWLAIDRSDRELARSARAATAGTPVRLAALPGKYPQASPVLLAWAITGRAVPPGLAPLDTGVLVLACEAVAALGDYANSGRALLDRVVTVAGPAIERTGHYRIPLGTPFHEVLGHAGIRRHVIRVVDGGIMTGAAVDSLDTVVTAETAAILAVDHEHDQVPASGPCIRCGWCQDGCPVGLDPQALLDCFERHDLARARPLTPAACLECGLCSYVCPAELPLSESMPPLKRLVARNGQAAAPPVPTEQAREEGAHGNV